MVTNNAINNSMKVTIFRSSGTFTKDPRTKWAIIIGWGAGGGGGSGRRGANGTNVSGGGGGSCQGSFYYVVPESAIGVTESVTIPGTALGGPSVGTDDTNGNNGSNGGAAIFGNIRTYSGAVNCYGSGGTSVSGIGGSAPTIVTNMGAFTGAAGGTGNPTNGSNGDNVPTVAGVTQSLGSGTGGGGGGKDSADAIYNGGNGGVVTTWASAPATILTSGVGGLANHNNATAGKDGALITSGCVFSGATGGGGGGARNDGGNTAGNFGGTPGGGGGGAGAVVNGLGGSTAGGNGAQGLIQVYEFF